MEDRLRKFVRVAETMSFTRAARELHTSQPALSVAIRKLERELGVTLIVRDHATLKLTPAGELAYAHAKDLDMQASNFKLKLQNLADQKPSAAIGMIDSIADGLLVAGDRLEHFENQVHMTLSINNSRYLLQALERDELDIACVVSPSAPLSKKLSIAPLGIEPLVGVATPARAEIVRHTLAKEHPLPDFLAYDKPSHTNQLIGQYFAKRRVQLDTIFHSTSPEIILHMALAGRGSAVLPYALVAEHIKQSKLTPLTGVIERPVAAVWRTDKLLPPIIGEVRYSVKNLLTAQNKAAERITRDL